jgi:hypothetical protein
MTRLGLVVILETIVLAALWLVQPGAADASASVADEAPRGDQTSGKSNIDRAPTRQEAPLVRRASDAASGAGTDGQAVIVLCGTVVDHEGRPCEREASIQVARHDDPGQRGSGPLRNGLWSIPGLTAGRHRLSMNLDGFEPVAREVELVADRPVERVDIVLTRATVLTVRFVTPEGEPLARALAAQGLREFFDLGLFAVATIRPPEALPQTSGRGDWRFGAGVWRPSYRGPDDGTLQLRAPLPLYASAVLRHVVLASKLVAAGETAVAFTIPVEHVLGVLGSLRLRLLDAESGRPLAGAKIGVDDSSTVSMTHSELRGGTFERTGLRPGLLDLRVSADGYASFERLVRIPSGGRLDLGDVRMSRPATLRGAVVDAEGRPARCDLHCEALDVHESGLPLRDGVGMLTDERGRFASDKLRRGRYLLRASDKDGAVAIALADTSSGAAEVKLVLRPGVRIELDNRLGPERGLVATVLDAGLLPVASTSLWGGHSRTLTLPAGRYELQLWDDNPRLVRQIPFTAVREPVCLEVKR